MTATSKTPFTLLMQMKPVAFTVLACIHPNFHGYHVMLIHDYCAGIRLLHFLHQ